MKKEKLRHYANVLSSHADSHWVTPIFALLYFLDSLILIVPVDSLLAASVALKPKNVTKWSFSSFIGFAAGLILASLLINSHLQPWFFELFQQWGLMDKIEKAIQHANTYGYWELGLAVFTFLPCLFAIAIGAMLKLNPITILIIAYVARVVKVLLIILLIFTTSTVLKKWLGAYLKTSLDH